MAFADLKGKVALVTGAGGGIGTAIAARLASEGVSLLLTDRDDEALRGALETATAAGVPAWSLSGDLGDPGFCDTLINAALERAGELHILVNNAGLMRRGSILEASDDDYHASFAINVEAPFRLCRAAIAHMKDHGGGAIVNVSSCWGVRPGPNHLVYCVTKAALASMTQCLGHDHARDQVRVNAVCPNEVNTPMIRTGFARRGFDPDDAIAELNDSVPLGHIAEPEEIASVVAFLASRDAGYMCGALVEVNGGKPVY